MTKIEVVKKHISCINAIPQLIILIWIILFSYLTLIPIYNPDEVWFYLIALNNSSLANLFEIFKQLFAHDNTLGYGGLWWTIYIFIIKSYNLITPIPLIPSEIGNINLEKLLLIYPEKNQLLIPLTIMRSLMILSLAFYYIKLISFVVGLSNKIFISVLLITLPLSWWSGKLASPEFIASSFFSLGVLFYFIANQNKTSIILLVLALSLKPTLLPLFLAFICVYIYKEKFNCYNQRFKKIFILLLLIISIYIIFNLNILISPVTYFRNINSSSGTISFNISNLMIILNSNIVSWDMQNYGSLIYWSGTPLFLLISLYIAFKYNQNLFYFILFGGILLILFMLFNNIHGWYFFPLILCAVIPYVYISNKKDQCILAVVVVIQILSLGFYNEISARQKNYIEIIHAEKNKSCIYKNIDNIKYDLLLDMSSIYNNGINNLSRLNYFDSFLALAENDKKLENKSIILIIGNNSYLNKTFILNTFMKKAYIFAQCGSISLYKKIE